MFEVSAKKNDRTVTVALDLGENLEDAKSKFGEEVVYTNFRANSVIGAQAAIRRMIEQGYDDSTIATRMSNWRPGVQMERSVDPKQAVIAAFGKMSAEEKAAFIRNLQASLGQ